MPRMLDSLSSTDPFCWFRMLTFCSIIFASVLLLLLAGMKFLDKTQQDPRKAKTCFVLRATLALIIIIKSIMANASWTMWKNRKKAAKSVFRPGKWVEKEDMGWKLKSITVCWCFRQLFVMFFFSSPLFGQHNFPKRTSKCFSIHVSSPSLMRLYINECLSPRGEKEWETKLMSTN